MKLLPGLFPVLLVALNLAAANAQETQTTSLPDPSEQTDSMTCAEDQLEAGSAMPSCCMPGGRFSSIAKSSEPPDKEEADSSIAKPQAAETPAKDSKSVPEPAISLIGGLALAAILIRRRTMAQ